MSEKQKVIVSLTLVLETCNAAVELIATGNPTTVAELASLRSDFTSILSLIHASSNKLSLVLKPAGPTYKAALEPLSSLTKHTSALAHCAILHTLHGQTLFSAIASASKDVIHALWALVQTFLRDAHDGSRSHLSTGNAGEEYMIRTAALHEIIDRLRKSDGLPTNNRDAVKTKWRLDAGGLQDGLREVAEMIEEEEGDGQNYDDMDEGWDELGMGSGEKMSSEEIERTRKVHTILRLTTLMHKRVMLDVLSVSPPPAPSSKTSITATPPTAFDDLLQLSPALLAASDELVATLYTPQDPKNTKAELSAFSGVVRNLEARLAPTLPELCGLEMHLAGMSLADPKEKPGGAKTKDPRKWFETCFQQVYKSVETLARTLP